MKIDRVFMILILTYTRMVRFNIVKDLADGIVENGTKLFVQIASSEEASMAFDDVRHAIVRIGAQVLSADYESENKTFESTRWVARVCRKI